MSPSPANTPAEPLLSVSAVSKAFGDHQVLRAVDLEVARGEVVAIIGASGSGKTTLLRSLNGLETPDAGVVTAGGVAVDFGALAAAKPALADRQRAALRDKSAMVFQHYHLFPHRTVLQNVTEGPIVVQKRPREEAEREAYALLKRVGLSDKADAYPHRLSGGQQQRVGIVRALALKPEPAAVRRAHVRPRSGTRRRCVAAHARPCRGGMDHGRGHARTPIRTRGCHAGGLPGRGQRAGDRSATRYSVSRARSARGSLSAGSRTRCKWQSPRRRRRCPQWALMVPSRPSARPGGHPRWNPRRTPDVAHSRQPKE
ncbi:hypothetical protein GCM10025876_07270 [Demequina litorisediminis]|uniref:ABC transporter domain-containing protein n=1 Tax=Demequina litorisediminis TaxID=1849022 RepID=A0ABQ6I9J3_9MICO|nr:hypothetical protein GCM10025876_07270 [Demequina litorisediminis]